jgi:teichuronic acid biosynthesis glycosyltransferase TuaG
MGDLVSVIIPTYNAAHYISRAIESVLQQTMPDLQVIVANDGSIDGTETIVQTYGARVEYIRINHAGLPAVTRNAGLSIAKGEYIAFLDTDDVWLPEKLEKQLAAMRRENCLASSTNAWRVQTGESESLYFKDPVPEILTFQHLLSANFVICSSAMLHHSVLERIGNFPESPSLKAWEDYAFWLRAAAITNWAYILEPLIRYTDMPSQSIRRGHVSVFEQKHRVLENFQGWARNAGMPHSFVWQAQQALVFNYLAETRQNLRGRFVVKRS